MAKTTDKVKAVVKALAVKSVQGFGSQIGSVCLWHSFDESFLPDQRTEVGKHLFQPKIPKELYIG